MLVAEQKTWALPPGIGPGLSIGTIYAAAIATASLFVRDNGRVPLGDERSRLIRGSILLSIIWSIAAIILVSVGFAIHTLGLEDPSIYVALVAELWHQASQLLKTGTFWIALLLVLLVTYGVTYFIFSSVYGRSAERLLKR
ncbi:ABZJ_00895 family protein [Inquilinus sp. OTU3971]|uniref:ABZJ_00895 family protein n=1 Tax=Inquilinus sp. OTU3971 TaxID=3043855 RepID=UPI00406CE72E